MNDEIKKCITVLDYFYTKEFNKNKKLYKYKLKMCSLMCETENKDCKTFIEYMDKSIKKPIKKSDNNPT